MGEVKEKLEVKKAGGGVASLKEAKNWLQRGDLADIATECGVTRCWISEIMKDPRKNFSIAEKIIMKAEHNKALAERAKAL